MTAYPGKPGEVRLMAAYGRLQPSRKFEVEWPLQYSWGDSVVVSDSEEVGPVCALTERADGVFYTVEFEADGGCV